VHRVITSLAERGHIRVLPGRARSIVLSGRHSLLNALGRPHESALMLLAEAAKADPLDILRDLIDDAIVHNHVATQSPETSRKESAHV